MFYNFFRMKVEHFDELLEDCGPHLVKYSWRKPIPPGERLAICLRYFASGDSFVSLSYLFLVSNQAISNIVSETAVVIWAVLNPKVFEPLTEEFWLRIAAEFEVLWKLLHCLGAIDGKHFFIKAPPHSGSRYYSYKKRFSLILLAVADAKRRFIIVDAGASGRRGDGNVFHSSVFGTKLARKQLNIPPPCAHDGMEKKLPFFFVGDGAFEKGKNLVNPFNSDGGKFSLPARLFDYRLSSARHVVEDAFGLMHQRFEVFKAPMEVNKVASRYVVLACTALHNFHLLKEDSVSDRRPRAPPSAYFDYTKENGQFIKGRYKNEDPEEELEVFQSLCKNVDEAKEMGCDPRDELEGEEIREELLDFSIDNPVPWQWEKAHVS